MSGEFIDFRRGELVEARAALDSLLDWTAPARSRLGVEVSLPERNGAERAREALDAGVAIEDIYRDAVAETKRTYTGARQAA
jgi:hypothetical protein